MGFEPMPLSRQAPKASALTTRPNSRNVEYLAKKESQPGLEPAISASGGRASWHGNNI